MLDAAKQAKEDAEAIADAKEDAKKAIDDAADKAIEDIMDDKEPGDPLTPEEQALIDEINEEREKAKDDIDKITGDYPDILKDIQDRVDDAQDVFDDKVAEDFVNDHASDNDATDPYDKANNPVDEDNAQRVVDGQDEWNNASDSVKEKIDELIKQKSEDSDEPYSGYEDMLYTAQKILNPDELTVPEVQEIMVKDGYIHVDIQVENLIDPDNKYADNIDEIIRILSKSIDQSDADVFNAGGSVEIVMIIREIESDPANDAAIKADGNTLVKHIEILITKTQIAEDGTTIASKDITKTAEPITFVVPLGDAEKEGRVFYVYADHGGRAPAEKNPDGDGVRVTATVAFTNDKFSVFSIAYTEDEKVVDTSDPTPILSTIMLMYSSFGAAVLTGRKRREEEEMY
ncbi:MAG: hypothetical protein II473_00600, partial [Clostridia bacterium]|nr:hypothetical protein [Clostridia bacterium]